MRIHAILECLVAFICGSASIVLPIVLNPDPWRVPYSEALIPVVRESIEGMKWYSLPLLVAIGIALGVWGRTSALALSVSAVALFPLYSILDIAVRGTGEHSVFVMECIFWVLMVLFPLSGVGIARFARRKSATRT